MRKGKVSYNLFLYSIRRYQSGISIHICHCVLDKVLYSSTRRRVNFATRKKERQGQIRRIGDQFLISPNNLGTNIGPRKYIPYCGLDPHDLFRFSQATRKVQ